MELFENMNPYKILGVRKNANQKGIKKAFRNKVKEAHPDTGGTKEAFMKVRFAYGVLGNLKKKKLYDEKGILDEQSELSFDGDVIARIAKLFEQFIQSGTAFKKDIDIIKSMEETAIKIKATQQDKVNKLHKVETAFKELQNRITSNKDDKNIFSKMVDIKLNDVAKVLHRSEREIKIIEQVIVELDAYECITELVQRVQMFTFAASGATTTGSGY